MSYVNYPGKLSNAELLQLSTYSESTERKSTLLTDEEVQIKKTKWSCDNMPIDQVRSGRTGKIFALSDLRLVPTSRPLARYFPIWPSHLVNKYTQ